MRNKAFNKSGFTLVEVIVTLAILSMIVVMVAGLTNYTAGRLRSLQQRNMNYALRAALDQIGQKMYSANEYVKIGSTDVYGFRYYQSADPSQTANADMLVIVSSYDNSTAKCTFFGYDLGAKKLLMAQSATCDAFLTISSLSNSVLPSRIKLTDFSITTDSQMMDSTSDAFVPRIVIDAKVSDVQDSTKISQLKTTFSMDGYNVKRLQSL
jgi:prepilin-type N-terminal cleavage/methylation domain-containing protein